MDSTQSAKSTGFTPIFRISENSERIRESDPGVQIVPASRSPSELSAHQMGLSLAGTTRLKEESFHSMSGSSALAIEERELSISDRALMRRYGPSGQQQESTRELDTHHGTVAVVQRVDGHPLQGHLNLYDRMLLRKYSVPGNASMPSYCSSLSSIPPTTPPEESTKKRRRFFKKGKLSRDMKKEACQVQEGSPCGFLSQVAEPPVRAGTTISHSASSPELAHFTLLHHTLVRDGALPLGYLQEFISLESPARRPANRLQASAIAISDSSASTALVALRRESEQRASLESSIADQMVIAADMRPKRFRTKWQRIVYDGPTARKDAETAERDRWIQLLANLLRSTDTPMGKLIRENPSNIQLLGGGRRAGTLRSRVRSVQKFLGWLIASHGISFPVHWRQLTEYLQVRYSEPCVRGSLKLVHSSFVFLQEVAGIEDKLTDSAMYVVALKELMSQASPGKHPRQAPRFPTILLAAFEDVVLSDDKPVFLRVLSWWLLVQSWGTLRFDDHRGLLPRDFVVTSTGLQARLTRSKVSGSDKHLNFRSVIIHPSAYIQRESWLSVGWKLLQESAPHERDYLLPAPTNNYQGFKIKELKYSTAFAVQTHITYRGLRIFGNSTGHYYTLHSGRNFMPSAAAVLGFARTERDILGGWAADGSQRFTRTAKYKIAQMQIAVASTFKNPDPDQLAESDDLDCLADFLRSWDVPESSIRKSLQILGLRSYADLQRSDFVEPVPADCDVAPCELSLDILDEEAEGRKKVSKEKQQAGNRGRSELLGSDHKQARSEIRSQLQEGYYISHSGKKAIRVVHCLGRCYMLPGVDYLSFTYAGEQFPASDAYDSVCKWCARASQSKADPGPQVRTLRPLPTSEFTL